MTFYTRYQKIFCLCAFYAIPQCIYFVKAQHLCCFFNTLWSLKTASNRSSFRILSPRSRQYLNMFKTRKATRFSSFLLPTKDSFENEFKIISFLFLFRINFMYFFLLYVHFYLFYMMYCKFFIYFLSCCLNVGNLYFDFLLTETSTKLNKTMSVLRYRIQ